MEMKTDYLIIGSGVAGLSFALQAARSGTVNCMFGIRSNPGAAFVMRTLSGWS